jgi:hypothetical protein
MRGEINPAYRGWISIAISLKRMGQIAAFGKYDELIIEQPL